MATPVQPTPVKPNLFRRALLPIVSLIVLVIAFFIVFEYPQVLNRRLVPADRLVRRELRLASLVATVPGPLGLGGRIGRVQPVAFERASHATSTFPAAPGRVVINIPTYCRPIGRKSRPRVSPGPEGVSLACPGRFRWRTE